MLSDNEKIAFHGTLNERAIALLVFILNSLVPILAKIEANTNRTATHAKNHRRYLHHLPNNPIMVHHDLDDCCILITQLICDRLS